LFSLNRFNLISFFENDYGDTNNKSQKTLKEKMLYLLDTNGIDTSSIKKIYALTYPRVLGFSFNPITVFYCCGGDGSQRAVIYEVRNTFGERHNYIFNVPQGAAFATSHLTNKMFHVSPFFDRQGVYNFKITDPAEHIMVSIDYRHEGARRLFACFKGEQVAFTNANLLRMSLKIPFMTVLVVAGILYEACLLWVKGIKVFQHPAKHAYQSSPAHIKPQKNNYSQEGKTYEKS